MGVHGGFKDGTGASGGFKEEDHPRDAEGHFSDKGGGEDAGSGGSGSADTTDTEDTPATGTRKTADKQGNPYAIDPNTRGALMPGSRHLDDAEIAALKPPVPPACWNVQGPIDPGSHLVWKAQDQKGRWKQEQTSEFDAGQAAAKFARVKEFHTVTKTMLPAIEAEARAPGPQQDSALVARLISMTGFRPGSDADTQAKVQAYGATTLEAQHVTVDGDTVHFDFIGKEGVHQEHDVTDPLLAREIRTRKEAGGKLFPGTSQAKLLAYVQKTSGNPEFKTKDFRTWVGTQTAAVEVETLPAPQSLKEFKTARLAVGTVVGRKLGNKPEQSLSTYIDPDVFSSWRAGLEGANDGGASDTGDNAGDHEGS